MRRIEADQTHLSQEPYDKDKRFAAGFLGVSRFSIDRYVCKRKLPHIKLNNRLVRFRVSDLVSFAERQRVA
jgi:hypothetical protein